MKEWFESLDILNGNTEWILRVAAMIAGALVVDLVQRFILGRLERKAAGTGTPWDDSLVLALKKPLSLFVWVLGISFALEITGRHTEGALVAYVPAVRTVGVIVSLGWFLLRWVRKMEEILLQRGGRLGERELDTTTIHALRKVISLSVWVTMTIITLQTLGFNLSAVLTVGGIGGVAIGFASRDVIANFFGGLMVYITQPFRVGDWIRSPDKNLEGTVEEIGWYQTRIRTFDKRPLYVPNSVFTSIIVENPSRMSNRRIYETVGIRYDDLKQMAAITEGVKAMLREHPEIDTGQTMIVNFNAFNSSSCDFFVYTFTKTTDWVRFHEIKEDVLLKVAGVVEKNGAEMAFPTRTLHMVPVEK